MLIAGLIIIILVGLLSEGTNFEHFLRTAKGEPVVKKKPLRGAQKIRLGGLLKLLSPRAPLAF